MLDSEKNVCSDIYEKIITKYINTFKRFRESWLKSKQHESNELFRYADDEFYFYRFAIGVEERNTNSLMYDILCELLNRYQYDFKVPSERKDAPFDFIIKNNSGCYGYTFEYYNLDEDINGYLKMHKVNKAYIIILVRGNENRYIKNDNEMYKEKNFNVEVITIQSFFEKYFSIEEYNEFEKYINEFIARSKRILGYHSIKVLSSMNLSARKLLEEKKLIDWDYEHYKYQIINSQNEKLKRLKYISEYDFGNEWLNIKKNYIDNELYKAMVGTEDYAVSFITSEWLYYSLKDECNYDYTAIVTGYLKSIEQLLYKLIMLNINNNCVILMSNEILKNQKICKDINIYEFQYDNKKKDYEKKLWVNENKKPHYPYIDFTEEMKEYMDSSIGTFEYFFRFNPNILINPKLSNIICDMISCFRIESRNGYFHTHNLLDKIIVKKTRENAIFLYALLLGTVKKAKENKALLGIINEDRFDKICKEIRELRHYSPNFIFVYGNGIEKKMIYDFKNNTLEYSDNGMEHYESLMFYDVEDFTTSTYERLDTPVREKWAFLLTKDNLPIEIYCYDIKKNKHNVTPELLIS